MKVLRETKKILKHSLTLNDNQTYDITSIAFGMVVTIGCGVFIYATIVLKLQPDYLQFFSGIASCVAAFGFSKSKFGEQDPTKIPKYPIENETKNDDTST